MFYISSVIDKDRKIGVTDTRDGVEEFYTDAQIVKFLKEDKIDIYGTSYYNYKANCTALKINQTLSVSKLTDLVNNWKKVHNQWSGHPVEDYLAEAKIGTTIRVDYSYHGDGDGRLHSGTTVIKKLSYDEWSYIDDNNCASGGKGNHRFAGWCLEVSCVYSSKFSISIM